MLTRYASFAGIAIALLALASQAAAQQSGLQPENPELKSQQGRQLPNAVAGELAIISATINSNATEREDFIAMVEARDSLGVTQLLEFQTGQVSENGSVEVGISWTPDLPGTYQLRTFLLSDLQEPQVMSGVMTKEVTVQEEEE